MSYSRIANTYWRRHESFGFAIEVRQRAVIIRAEIDRLDSENTSSLATVIAPLPFHGFLLTLARPANFWWAAETCTDKGGPGKSNSGISGSLPRLIGIFMELCRLTCNYGNHGNTHRLRSR